MVIVAILLVSGIVGFALWRLYADWAARKKAAWYAEQERLDIAMREKPMAEAAGAIVVEERPAVVARPVHRRGGGRRGRVS